MKNLMYTCYFKTFEMVFTVDKFTFIKREQKWVDGCSFFYVEWKDEEGISFYKYGTTCDCNCYIINKGCHSFEPLICLINRHFGLNLIDCSIYESDGYRFDEKMAIEQKDVPLPKDVLVISDRWTDYFGEDWEETGEITPSAIFSRTPFPSIPICLDKNGKLLPIEPVNVPASEEEDLPF